MFYRFNFILFFSLKLQFGGNFGVPRERCLQDNIVRLLEYLEQFLNLAFSNLAV